MRRVVVPQASGVLSALGLIVSERRRELVASELLAGDALTREAVAQSVERLAAQGREELGGSEEPEVRVRYDLRYTGQAFEITVPGEPEPDIEELRRAFDEAHERRYGYSDPDATLELVTVRVAVALPGGELAPPVADEDASPGRRQTLFEGEWVDATVLRGRIGAVSGPAVCELREATLVVPPGWSGGADEDGTIVLERG
jgi:N-methylhydantoinase A